MALCLSLFFVPTGNVFSAELSGSKPNIILVVTDDQGMGDLSCMGNDVVKTPNIDKFYEGSTRFTDFQVSPTCAPTRAALMSGRQPFKVGVTHTILQRERMALDVFTLPQAMKTAGYATGIFGKWHLGDEDDRLPGNRGFDEALTHGAGGIGQVRFGDFPPNGENPYYDTVLLHNDTIVKSKGYCTDVFFDSAMSWIDRQRDTEEPYFVYLATNAPHAPMIVPKSYSERFTKLGYDKDTAGRYGMIENIDENFGKLIAKLEDWGQLENTLVIFMTDNGATHLSAKLNGKKLSLFNANLKGAKNSPDEGGTHVPAFWSWKGVTGQGVDIDGLAAHLDIYPTFAALAGAKLPKDMQTLDGRSLLPLFEDADAEWPDRELFIHCGRWSPGKRDQAKYQKCAVRTEKWRFVNNERLYDISSDPSQKEDVASTHPEVVAELRKAFDKWWESALPLMVNEGLPKVEEQPLHVRYEKQLAEKGIPEWVPEPLR